MQQHYREKLKGGGEEAGTFGFHIIMEKLVIPLNNFMANVERYLGSIQNNSSVQLI